MSYQAVLFDLDGTLLDTAPDLAAALNQVLRNHQRPALSYKTIQPYASHGSLTLLSLGFTPEEIQANNESLKTEFLSIYEQNIATHTQYFAGVEALLDRLQERSIPFGTVTNKPSRYTQALLESFPRLLQGPVISGDTLEVAKPHPAPLLHAASQLNIKPEHCCYIGDAERDIQAANAANMDSFIASWGYIGPQDQPQNWQSKFQIEQPTDLIQWFD